MLRFIVPAMTWVSPHSGKEQMIVDGFYVQGKEPNWARLNRYRQWQRYIQECAVMSGLELPLRPTKEEPIYVVVVAYYSSRTHCDVGNTFKSVVDALCYVSPLEQKLGVKRGSDKYVGGAFWAPRYDKESPRVEVFVMSEREFEQGGMSWLV